MEIFKSLEGEAAIKERIRVKQRDRKIQRKRGRDREKQKERKREKKEGKEEKQAAVGLLGLLQIASPTPSSRPLTPAVLRACGDVPETAIWRGVQMPSLSFPLHSASSQKKGQPSE